MSGIINSAGSKSGVIESDNKKVGIALGLVGTINGFGMSTAPTGWLICDGSGVASATYMALYNAIGTTWGGNSTTFTLPDLRGKFIRGWANGSTNDPDRATRTGGDVVGSNQPHGYPYGKYLTKGWRDDTTPYTVQLEGGSGPYGSAAFASLTVTQYDGYYYNSGQPDPYHYRYLWTQIGVSGATETRPRNDNVLYCIFFGK